MTAGVSGRGFEPVSCYQVLPVSGLVSRADSHPHPTISLYRDFLLVKKTFLTSKLNRPDIIFFTYSAQRYVAPAVMELVSWWQETDSKGMLTYGKIIAGSDKCWEEDTEEIRSGLLSWECEQAAYQSRELNSKKESAMDRAREEHPW